MHVWRLSLVGQTISQKMEATLSIAERARAERFLVPQAKLQFVATRACLRSLLSRYLKIPADRISIETSGDGKPVLTEDSLHFNVSHSGDLALLAVSRDAPVGVDLEKIDPSRDMQAIARRYFHPNESKRLQEVAVSDRTPLFYRLWTLKEAYLKALGTGISGGLAALEVDGDFSRPQFYFHGEDVLKQFPRGELIALPDPLPGYAAALAVLATVPKLELYHFEF